MKNAAFAYGDMVMTKITVLDNGDIVLSQDGEDIVITGEAFNALIELVENMCFQAQNERDYLSYPSSQNTTTDLPDTISGGDVSYPTSVETELGDY